MQDLRQWTADEGRRFESEAFIELLKKRKDDPVPPIRLANVPKSTLKKLFSEDATDQTLTTAMDAASSTTGTSAGNHKGMDYLFFEESTSETRLQAPCGTYLAVIPGDAKTNPSDHSQLYSCESAFLRLKMGLQWGSVHPHYIIAVPQLVTQCNQRDLENPVFVFCVFVCVCVSLEHRAKILCERTNVFPIGFTHCR